MHKTSFKTQQPRSVLDSCTNSWNQDSWPARHFACLDGSPSHRVSHSCSCLHVVMQYSVYSYKINIIIAIHTHINFMTTTVYKIIYDSPLSTLLPLMKHYSANTQCIELHVFVSYQDWDTPDCMRLSLSSSVLSVFVFFLYRL